MKHTRTPSLLAATFATALLFSAGHVLADNPPNEPEENAQNDSSQPVTDTWITTKVKADLLAYIADRARKEAEERRQDLNARKSVPRLDIPIRPRRQTPPPLPVLAKVVVQGPRP